MSRKLISGFVLCVALAFAQGSPAELDNLVKPELGSLKALYTYLHQHPELSLHEKETSVRIAKELAATGFEVTTGVGGYGVVGVLKNGKGPVVLVRTELDALPVTEQTGKPYASKVRTQDDQGNEVGVMHACGHDMHMTLFIGTARVLNRLKDRWSGTAVFIGQPSEERISGASAMLNDGLYKRFPRPDYCLAYHVDAALEAGRIGVREGYSMANVDTVNITIRGVGGHGAYPHLTKDPVVIAAEVILALQTIVSREVRPIDPAVVTVGSIHGGTKNNIIPDQVDLQLTLRSYSDETRQLILEAVNRITLNIARAAGVPADREPIIQRVSEDYTPANYNDPALVRRLVPVWKKLLGENNVVPRDPEMGGEDFARYGLVEPKVPCFLIRLGAIDGERMAAARSGGAPLPSLHSSLFWPALDPTLENGIKGMTAAVIDLLHK